MAGTLQTALSGLHIAQQQINTISANVSNVGTPGYSRKILPQSTQAINGVAIGVTPEKILRNVDMNLTANLWTQISSVNSFSIQEAYLKRIEQFHGAPGDEFTIAASLGDLRDAFSTLADSPEDSFLLANTVSQAEDTAKKIRDLSAYITQLRNDAQDEMQSTVNRINGLLEQIAELNTQVKTNTNLGRTTAQIEDTRDQAVKDLTELIEISFFTRGDGTLVIQTNDGVEIAGNTAEELYFNPNNLTPSTYYPYNVEGVYVNNPVTDPLTAIDITSTNLGGKLGGLITLRDTTFPKQMAQLDELAHKMALRFQAQGLELFTDDDGTIPLDTAPDITTIPPTPVEYVGFSAVIQVNDSIVLDNSLIHNGTYGATLQAGDNEVIARVIEHAFGGVDYQIAQNLDTTAQVDLLNRGGADLQTWLGLDSDNEIRGGRNIASYASIAAMIASANGDLDTNPPADTFDVIFTEPNIPLGPITLTVDMSDADALGVGANAGAQMVDYLNNTLIPAAGFPAGLTAVASLGPNGELIIDTNGSYEIDSSAGIGETGLIYLGLSDNAGTPVDAEHPYFDITVGNNETTRIYIKPGDTDVELLAQLSAVEGLAIDTTNFALDGLLRLRPGDDFDDPNFGGDLTITSGPFTTSGATYGQPPAVTGTRAALDNGVNIISALFGSYNATSLQNEPVISDVYYGSEAEANLGPPIPTLGFREQYLGPGASINSNVIGSTKLIDFAQKILNEHAQEIIILGSRRADEESLQNLLEDQLSNESGVNLDEELGHLIVVQTAYGAAARVITAVDEMFEKLLAAV